MKGQHGEMSNEHEGSLTDYDRWRGAGVIEKVMRFHNRRASPVEIALDAYAVAGIASGADMEAVLARHHKPGQARCALNDGIHDGTRGIAVSGTIYADADAALQLLDEIGDKHGGALAGEGVSTVKQRQRDQARCAGRCIAASDVSAEPPIGAEAGTSPKRHLGRPKIAL